MRSLCRGRIWFCVGVLVLVGRGALAADATGFTPAMVDRLGLPAGFEPTWQLIAAGRDRHDNDAAAAANGLNILRFEGCHVGGQRLLLKVTFSRPALFTGRTFIVYADLDNDPATGRQDAAHKGVDVQTSISGDTVSVGLHNRAFTKDNTFVRGIARDNVLYLTIDAPVVVDGDQVKTTVYLLSQKDGGQSDSTARRLVTLPRSTRDVPALSKGGSTLRSLDDFRFVDSHVMLERRQDKGLTFAQVAPKEPIKIGRPVPAPTFAEHGRQPAKAGSVARRQVRVQLLEEAGVARSDTSVTFGCPFPQGGVFDPQHVRLLSPDGRELVAQVAVTAFWPDDSLKWVLLDTRLPLAANAAGELVVEFGRDVHRAATDGLQVGESDTAVTVRTGGLVVVLDKVHFNLFRGVSLPDRAGGADIAASADDGVRLVDEQGKLFTSAGIAPESVRVEESGPHRVVVRVEGRYGAADGTTYQRYIARVTFRPGARVTVAWTHVDDWVQTEFTDLTSLTMPLVPAGGIRKAALLTATPATWQPAPATGSGQSLSVFQTDERTSELKTGGQRVAGERSPGVARCAGDGGPLTLVGHEFWQRWPKGLTADAKELTFSILPEQPSADYGKGLPHQLIFPFCEGKYRFKWGMAFTTRVTFDFGARLPVAELLADANLPVVATLPADWYVETNALGAMAAPREKQFAVWDDVIAKSYAGYLVERDKDRAYGYLNFGDWYGERGRNWGNNEYDLAHSFFMQFARTGRRDYFRLAQAAARHQTDVDCVHAYPDPYYLGANHQHSIGHTGQWSEQPERATWTHRYDYHTEAANGHTWASGMVDAWCLSGEPRIMEGALGLGEHIAWAMSRNFHELGTHERSAGWSLCAIMALYQQTHDPEYLAAAKRIAAVALREQKFDRGGAWPHVLPGDHAGDHPGGVGNNLFLMGVLLGGLQAYHEETRDPAVLKSLQAGVNWVTKSWHEQAGGWPYSALADGTPCHRPSTSLNCLIIGPLAYVGTLTGDERLLHIAEVGLTSLVFSGASTSGKSIAQEMFFTNATMARLQAWTAKRPDHGLHLLDGSAESVAAFFAKTPFADRHAARGPDDKVFCVELRAPSTELIATRRPHGAMTRQAPTGTIKVLGSGGTVIRQGQFSTDGAHEFRCPLTGAVGTQFTVEIHDDQRGVWNVAGEQLGVVLKLQPSSTIGGVGRGRYSFFVPAGTAQFKLRLVGIHNGSYGAVVLSPTGEPRATHQDANQGPALIRGAEKTAGPAPNTHPERGEIVVKPAAAETGKAWSVVLWAAGDIGVELDGVPPYLALTPAGWFEVR